MLYVAYRWVSTARQGQSGLGLEAQEAAVLAYALDPAAIVAHFREVESGKNNQRPQFAAAMAECRQRGAMSSIAKLDRMSPDAAYVLQLDVSFVAMDMPELNTLTKGMMAQHERELISKCITEALAAKKARGEALGTVANLPAEGRQKGRTVQQQNARQAEANRVAGALVALWSQAPGQAYTLRRMAEELNRLGLRTRRGCIFSAKSVQRQRNSMCRNDTMLFSSCRTLLLYI
ncbi:recombinase family protein [Hymenobacter sp. BT507]|uniref:Recombinase family protein n=1 Tax=Hymenobacter citatus TaxID=2763506 RepID=A0ABR7MR29_9BACT|nr:recombinase family protein [Hymenobacter citatus]MBC6613195.1 recombinase family protein [Hymenobacter citatus]